jgi:hypothetical protein
VCSQRESAVAISASDGHGKTTITDNEAEKFEVHSGGAALYAACAMHIC